MQKRSYCALMAQSTVILKVEVLMSASSTKPSIFKGINAILIYRNNLPSMMMMA